MTRKGLTHEDVLALIAAYGARPHAWPEPDRAPAEAVIAAAPEVFAAALADARALDATLAGIRIPDPSPALATRILATAPRPQRRDSAGTWLSRVLPRARRWPASAAFASLCMGIIGGYAYATTGGASYDTASDAYAAAFALQADPVWLEEDSAS